MPSIDAFRIIPGTGQITYAEEPVDLTSSTVSGTTTLNSISGGTVDPLVRSSLDFSNSLNSEYVVFL